jgi:hypothetical protein
MGREIMRVPMDFAFPVGKSYADAWDEKHRAGCSKEEHEDECGYWRDCLPEGDGWQLWQTVSDGPLSPVFASAEELIEWMSQPVPLKDRPSYDPEPYPRMPAGQGWRRETAERLVKGTGWIPSMVMVGGRILSTAEMVEELNSETSTKD